MYIFNRFEEPTYSNEQVTDFLKQIALDDLFAREDTWQQTSIEDLEVKFRVLNSCINEFKRDIPSSQLVYLQNVQDVMNYYQTKPQQPQYIELRPQSLPLNMKILMNSVKKPLNQS